MPDKISIDCRRHLRGRVPTRGIHGGFVWCFRANAEGADGAVSGHGTVGTGVFDRSMTRLPQETPPVAGEITNVFEGHGLRPPAHKGRCPKGSITVEVTRVVPTQPFIYCLPYQHITSTIASSPTQLSDYRRLPTRPFDPLPLTKTSLFDQRPFPNGSLSTASLSHATFWHRPSPSRLLDNAPPMRHVGCRLP